MEVLLQFITDNWLIFAYIVYLAVFIIFSAAVFYHCWEFGYIGDATKIAMTVYSIISLAIIILTFFLLGVI